MQHLPAFEMPAGADQRQAIAERVRFAVPKRDRRVGTHHPLAVVGVEEDRRVEGVAPFHHRRVVVWVRDRDRLDPAKLLHRPYRFVVEQRNTVPQHVAGGRLHQQRALGDRKARLRTDADQSWRFQLDRGVMIAAQVIECRPLLPGKVDVLSFILADRAMLRWLLRRRELRAAGNANKVFHMPCDPAPFRTFFVLIIIHQIGTPDAYAGKVVRFVV